MSDEIIAGLYRDIGKNMHSLGAEKVVILSSKAEDACLKRLTMEIAVSGPVDIETLEKCVSDRWDNVKIKIISLDENPQIDYEDGIVL